MFKGCGMAIKAKARNPFKKNWRDRKIVHRTPGGKLTRVKISSLPADEQQKYNPNRFKRGADTQMPEDEFLRLQRLDIDTGHIFEFYVQVESEEELSSLESGTLLLATTEGVLVPKLFGDHGIIMKLSNVPIDAVKSVAVLDDSDDIADMDTINVDMIDFEDIDEDIERSERYEKIKFNDVQIFKLDIVPHLKFINANIDADFTNISENNVMDFSVFYFKG